MLTDQLATPPVHADSPGLDTANLEKLSALRDLGVLPYPYSYDVTHAPEEVRRRFADFETSAETLRLASRVMAIRRSGSGLLFWDLAATSNQLRRDEHLQVILQRSQLDERSWRIAQHVSIGDWLGVDGVARRSRAGEPSLVAHQVTMLSKSVRPIPFPKVYRREDEAVGEAFTVADPELLWRMPELDILTREKGDVLVMRSRLLHRIRSVLIETYECVEIETPFLNSVFGGAEARPFITTVNALNQEFFLAVSPEIELKRAIVGGIGSGGRLGKGAFYIARNFRNEGIDRTHNPEFTSVEVYIPFVDYEAMMEVTERLFAEACCAMHGTDQIRVGELTLDFGRPWPRLPMIDLVTRHSGIDVARASVDEIRAAIRQRGLDHPMNLDGVVEDPDRLREALLDRFERSGVAAAYPDLTTRTTDELRLLALRHKLHRAIEPDQLWDFLVLDLFDVFCEPLLQEPCHVTLHPARSTVLCKEWRGGPLPNGERVIERFESFALGMEISNAYSELNDPLIQRALVEEQAAARQAGDDQAMPHNEQFLRAVEMGMPPCGGLGIGIDRMVMLLTGCRTIRDVIAFPLVAQER